jgi:RNA polymerase-binding transcription factor DksA
MAALNNLVKLATKFLNMAKTKGKDKKASKPAKAKGKPAAKKASKPVKKAAPKPKKAAKPVKKAKPVAKKAVKAKPVVKQKVAAKPAKKVVAKVAPKAKPVAKKAEAPVKQKAPVAVKSVTQRPSKNEVKRFVKEDVKPVKQLYKTQPKPQPVEPAKPAKKKPMEDLNLRYSDKELKEFKDLIDGKLVAAREELKNLKEALDNHTESQAGNKAWNMEEGTDTSEMEYLMNQISRQHQYIRNLELALVRIENKTYGICRVTGKLIPKERLRIVPHATLSLEAKNSRKADDNTHEAAATTAPPADFAEGFED